MRRCCFALAAALTTIGATASFADEPAWEKMPGNARAIGVGADGSIWIVGGEKTAAGYSIFQWNGKSWHETPGRAVRIAVDPQGVPWILNSKDETFYRVKDSWQKLPGAAHEIALGGDGTGWQVGTMPTNGGSIVFHYDGKEWKPIEGPGAMKIAVDPQGVVWIINNKNEIYRHGKDAWEQVPGSAREVAIGGDGSVWIIGTKAAKGGYTVSHWNGTGWDDVDGGGELIAVDPQGKPIVINSDHEILRRK